MLPALPQNTAQRHSEEIDIQPGTWWRLREDSDLIEDGMYGGSSWSPKPIPSRGLVLLVEEARTVDGEMHTIVLGYHPTWGQGSLKMLVEEFLENFVLEPNGTSVREAEIDEVMGRIRGLNERITQPGPEAEIKALIEKSSKEKAQSEHQGRRGDEAAGEIDTSLPVGADKVPSALLPGGDVKAVQAKIESQLAAINAQAAWIKEQSTKVTRENELLVRFHTEIAEQSMASIRSVTEQSKKMLASVKTMRLWLGEDMHVAKLVDGKSAPAEEPLTLMQRMLYLDEEIFVEGLLEESFDYKGMSRIGEILKTYPKLVERMLPYQRCVAITRIRRHSGSDMDLTKITAAEYLGSLAEKEANERIQILVRDGEKIWMIAADEATSHAKRLFPSKEEIDRIFTSGFSGGRAITPNDVDYTDARAQHDNTALFYKRFLIILWGLHEREDIFGSFMEKGQNWLTESVQSERFRFIHDEEGVLGDGRPSWREFVREANRQMKPGSMIAVNWGQVTQDVRPEIMYDMHGNQIRKPVVYHEVAQVKANGRSLVAPCATVKDTWDDDGKTRNALVEVVSTSLEYQNDHRYDSKAVEDMICLDNVTPEDLAYYIESRTNAHGYDGFRRIFAIGRRFLLGERAREAEMAEELGLDLAAPHMAQALRLWRSANNWALPKSQAHVTALQNIARALGGEIDLSPTTDAAEVRVTGNGMIVAIEDETLPLPSKLMASPFTKVTAYKIMAFNKLGASKVSWERVRPAEASGQIVLATRDHEAVTRADQASRTRLSTLLKTSADVAALESLNQPNPELLAELSRLMTTAPSEEWAQAKLDELRKLQWESKSRKIPERLWAANIGLVITPTRSDTHHEARGIQIVMDLYRYLSAHGYGDLVRMSVSRFYADPSRVLGRISARHGDVLSAFSLRLIDRRNLKSVSDCSSAQMRFLDGDDLGEHLRLKDEVEPLKGDMLRKLVLSDVIGWQATDLPLQEKLDRIEFFGDPQLIDVAQRLATKDARD
jgi:hypothetical protein